MTLSAPVVPTKPPISFANPYTVPVKEQFWIVTSTGISLNPSAPRLLPANPTSPPAIWQAVTVPLTCSPSTKAFPPIAPKNPAASPYLPSATFKPLTVYPCPRKVPRKVAPIEPIGVNSSFSRSMSFCSTKIQSAVSSPCATHADRSCRSCAVERENTRCSSTRCIVW